MRYRGIILATGTIILVLICGTWVLLGVKAPRVALGTTVRQDYSALLLSGRITNRSSSPVYLSTCYWECENNQGQVTNNARDSRAISQWTGVTNYRAAVLPTGRWDTSRHTESLLPGGVATILFALPANTSRARLQIVYQYRAGPVGSASAKILPSNILVRSPKTRQWLNRLGLLGYFTKGCTGEWISNQAAAGTSGIAPRSQIGHAWPAVPEQRRCPSPPLA